jgi:hypothetical protein
MFQTEDTMGLEYNNWVNITRLVKDKKYYVRIRTYKTLGGTKFYSGWSAAKAVTVKRDASQKEHDSGYMEHGEDVEEQKVIRGKGAGMLPPLRKL